MSASESVDLEPEAPPEPSHAPARARETDAERAERLAKQEEIDSRSVYVGNVDFQLTPKQLEEVFHEVGVIERITILFDKFLGLPKGYAYVEFENTTGATRAIAELHGRDFRGRELRVSAKRTNLPGFKRGRGRGRGGFRERGGGQRRRKPRNGATDAPATPTAAELVPTAAE